MARALKSLGVVVALFLLGGCFAVDLTAEISPDDTVSGTMLVAVDQAMADAMSEMGNEGGAGGEGASPFDTETLPDGVTAEPYEQDGKVGQKLVFADVPLEDFNAMMNQDDEGSFSLTHEGDTYVFTGAVSMGAEPSASADPNAPQISGLNEALEQMLTTASFTVSLTFPGEVTDTNGTVDGTTVTWDVDLTTTNEIHATALATDESASDEANAAKDTPADADTAEASSDEDSGFPVVPFVIGAVVLLALIAAGFFIVRRRTGS